MTLFASRIERLRGIQESSFAADMSGTMASFFEVPFNEGTLAMTLDRPPETPLHAQQRIGGYPVQVLLPKAATLSFTCNMETFSTKATSTVPATSHWLAEMLEAALGGSHLMTGTVITTGATTTVLPVSVATTVRPGACVGLNTGTGNALEMREVESKSGSDITIKLATSNAADDAATVLGTTTIFAHTRMTGGDAISMQFAVEGQNTQDRWLLKGGALDSLTLALAPGQIPRMTFSWKFADWEQADGAATAGDLVGPVLGAATYANVNTIVQADSELRVQTVGTSTLTSTLIEASTIEFRPNIMWEAVRTPSGTNTILQYVRTHVAPVVTGSIVLPYEDAQTWFTARDDRTAKAVWYQIGSDTDEGGILLSAPNTRITSVAREDVSGVGGQRLEFDSHLDTDTTAESGFEALAESPFRISFA